MALHLIARREGTDFVLFAGGRQFGRLSDCEVCHVYEGDYADEIKAGWEADFSPREMLAHIRKVLEGMLQNKRGTFSAEEWADDGMRRKVIAKALGDREAYKSAERQVEQACQVIRTRSANWMPPV